MKEYIMNNKRKLILWASISAAIILACAVAVWAYVTPYMYVSLDVNPSIEYSVNHFNRVLSAKAVNDDGSEILSDLNLKNKSINDAVKETVQKISDEGYFDGDIAGGVEIATYGSDASITDQADELATDLQSDVQEVTADEGKTVDVEASSATLERIQQAKELGITPGKLNLIQKLQASAEDPNSVSIEDWKDKPVKEIMKTIKDNRKAEQAKEKDSDQEDSTTTASTDTTAIGSENSTDSTTLIADETKPADVIKNNSAEKNQSKKSSITKTDIDEKDTDTEDEAEYAESGEDSEQVTSDTTKYYKDEDDKEDEESSNIADDSEESLTQTSHSKTDNTKPTSKTSHVKDKD